MGGTALGFGQTRIGGLWRQLYSSTFDLQARDVQRNLTFFHGLRTAKNSGDISSPVYTGSRICSTQKKCLFEIPLVLRSRQPEYFTRAAFG